MKILSVGAELLHADGRTDMTKQIVAFRNFANVRNRFKERKQKTAFSIVCAATQSTINRRVAVAQNLSFCINRIRPT